MNDIDNRPNLHTIFSLRNISFGIMALAVMAAVLFRNQMEQPSIEKIQDLEQRNRSLVLRVTVAEAVGTSTFLTDPGDKKAKEEQIEQFFHLFEDNAVDDSTDLRMARWIIFDYLGLSPNIKPDSFGGETPLLRDFRDLYFNQHSLSGDSPLFATPAGRLAKLKNLSLMGDHSAFEKEKERLVQESLRVLGFMNTIFVIFAMVFLASFPVLFLFFKHRPSVFYYPLLSEQPPELHRIYLETFILFLFLLFPLGVFLAGILPPSFHMVYNMAIFPVAFVVALAYFYQNSRGWEDLRRLFVNREGVNVFREVLWGIGGFVGIFPVAVIVLMGMVQLAGISKDGAVRFAHPAIFELKDHVGVIFFMAVVLAPIIEETMFRSVLYGYFRKNMRIRMAALFTGMLFALLHPQGAMALASLTILGMGLAVLREFRPGVIAPMVTHAMVNSLTVLGAYFLYYHPW